METRFSSRVMGTIAAILLTSLPLPGSAQDLKALCTPSEPTDPQALHINGAKPFIYKTVGNTELRLHVFSLPGRKAGAKVPAAVFFYGGGFLFGDIRRFQTQATHLALKGLVTVLVDYRVKCRNGTTLIDADSDAKSAMRWVRGHADELGIDPSRIAAVGSSAGGQMAAATALITAFDDPTDPPVDAKPNALVLYAPALDMAAPAVIASLIPIQGKAVADRAPDFSPMDHLDRGLPPTIIFQGTADRLFPQSEAFCDRAKALKYQCDVVTYPDAPHGFTEVWIPLDDVVSKQIHAGPALLQNTERWAADTSDRTDVFLARLGWLPQP